MKKSYLILAASFLFLFSACSDDDQSNASVDTALKASTSSNARISGVEGADSIIVFIESLSVKVGESSYVYDEPNGGAKYDLLQMDSAFNLIWENVEIPEGELVEVSLNMKKDNDKSSTENNYVVETAGEKVHLHITAPDLKFTIESAAELIAGEEYTLKLELVDYLNIDETGNAGKYNLSPVRSTATLVKVDASEDEEVVE